MIDKKPVHLVVAQARWVGRIMPIVLELSAPPVKASQPMPGGAEPKGAGMVLDYVDDHGPVPEARGKGSVMPGLAVDPNESVIVADPHSSFVILIDGVDEVHVQAVGVSRLVAELFKKRRPGGEVIGRFRMEPGPDVALPILEQADHFILSHAFGISRIVSIAHKALSISVVA